MQENTEQPEQVKKKLTKREVWLVAIAVLLLVAVAGLLTYILWGTKHSPKQTASDVSKNDQPAGTPALKPEDVTAKIKSTWQSKYKLVDLDRNNHPAQGELAVRTSKSSPIYKVAGYDFYVSYDGGSMLEAQPYDPNPNDYTYPKKGVPELRDGVIEIYKNLGLAETKTDATLFDTYIGSGLVCSVDASVTYFSYASCGVIDSYTASAEKLKPFAEAMPAKSPTTYLGSLRIEDSQVNGYQKAVAVVADINSTVGSMGASFYRKTPGNWIYFGKSQQGFLCTDYNTADLKNAFKGETCIDANLKESTVQ